jgi:hypothetical protein
MQAKTIFPETQYKFKTEFKSGEHWREDGTHRHFDFAITSARRYPKWRVIRLSDGKILAQSKAA